MAHKAIGGWDRSENGKLREHLIDRIGWRTEGTRNNW